MLTILDKIVGQRFLQETMGAIITNDIFVFSIFPARKMVDMVRTTNEETRITLYKKRK